MYGRRHGFFRQYALGINRPFDVMNGHSLDDDFGPSSYDHVEAAMEQAYNRSLQDLQSGNLHTTLGRGAETEPSDPQAPQRIENEFMSGQGVVTPEIEAARQYAEQGGADASALFGLSGNTQTPPPMSRGQQAQRQRVQQRADLLWNRGIQSLNGINATSAQRSEFFQKYQEAMGIENMPNPFSIETAGDEISDPAIKHNNLRGSLESIQGFDPKWSSLVSLDDKGNPKIPAFMDNVLERAMAKQLGVQEENGAISAAQKRAMEFAMRQHERRQPNAEDYMTEDDSLDSAAYNKALAAWEAQERAIVRKFDPEAEGALPTSEDTPDGQPQTIGGQLAEGDMKPEQRAEYRGVPFVNSREVFNQRLQAGELSVGDTFVDDAGRLLQVGPGGSLKVVK
jgi:hypothetical protein